jgi:hypothetical protein
VTCAIALGGMWADKVTHCCLTVAGMGRRIPGIGGSVVVWCPPDGALWYGMERCSSIYYTLLMLQGQTESVSGIK